MSLRAIAWSLVLFVGSPLWATQVHVTEQAVYGATTEILQSRTLATGSTYETAKAPVCGGYIFTHWSSSDSRGLDNRDVLGRARDSARFTPYGDTTLTANYLEDSVDTDEDGMPDGYELYWYGNLAETPDSDTDHDGWTFAQEVQYGANPHFADAQLAGVVYKDSDKFLYNPNGYAQYKIRSEPEGGMFDTVMGYAKPGDRITTPICSRSTSFFGYWRSGSAEARDVLGRAVDQVTFTMGDTNVEWVAMTVTNDADREKLYWYGTTSISLDSDTDGDGLTFAQEVAAGTNPLMPDAQLAGVVYNDSDEFLYNPEGYEQYVFRSDPEDELFKTQAGYAKPGQTITTPICSRQTSGFVCWTIDGERQCDACGRARDQLSFAMPVGGVEAVALVEDNATRREQLYWYGREQSLESDTDGDGMTFAQEIAAGTNPLMPDEQMAGIVYKATPEHELRRKRGLAIIVK